MNFDEFRESVMGDPALLQQFFGCESDAALFAAVKTAGGERGFELTETEFTAIMNANRRRWLERWTRQ